jgi:hypothetical protein
MSPTFNGIALFDSVNGSGGNFTEGYLGMGPYSKIVQAIHVNGENGNRLLPMGWGDRTWTFKGIISAPDITTLLNKLNAIQGYIDLHGGPTYYTLVTSMGDTFTTNAQITNMTPPEIRFRVGGGYSGYMTPIVVTGIVQGMQPDG